MELQKSVRPILDESGISQDAPYIRAMVINRLELIWKACLPHIDGSREESGFGVSTPMVETALRVTRELARMYRLDAPVAGAESQVAGTRTDVRALVSGQLDAIEARLRE